MCKGQQGKTGSRSSKTGMFAHLASPPGMHQEKTCIFALKAGLLGTLQGKTSTPGMQQDKTVIFESRASTPGM